MHILYVIYTYTVHNIHESIVLICINNYIPHIESLVNDTCKISANILLFFFFLEGKYVNK